MKKTFTAATVEEARQAAAADFGVGEDMITFTVIEEPKKGLFGKVKGEAKVEAEYEPPLTKADIAKNYMLEVMKAMGIADASITVSDAENGALFELSGEGLEELLGKKGELLDAFQYLSSLVCNKVDRDYFRISTDCNGFREKRKQQLEELARKIAANVKKSGRTSALEPMNPYERRIIHAAVSEIEGVTSRSTGEEPYRKVLISSTERRPRNNDFRGKGGRKGGNRRDRKPKAHYDITTSFEKDYKRPKPEDTLNAGLYGKIEF
ncbi:MAG: protein jag [Lachnospiraceae bacterium]|nr:protein jag [Lachnospiraceae bacterium]MBR4555374.1 protein jag [Ruminococcus sp.]